MTDQKTTICFEEFRFEDVDEFIIELEIECGCAWTQHQLANQYPANPPYIHIAKVGQ